MSVSKNNFGHEENKQRSKYKLWIMYKPEFKQRFKENPRTYFSFNTKTDGGYSSLVALAEKRSDMYLMAILYDNQCADKDKNELRRWSAGMPAKTRSDKSVGALKKKRPNIYRPKLVKRTW